MEPRPEIVRQNSTFFSLMFVVIGAVSFVTMFLQVLSLTVTLLFTDLNVTDTLENHPICLLGVK